MATSESSGELSPAGEAFAEYLYRRECGEDVDFDAFCAERPELAPSLRGLHDCLGGLEALAGDTAWESAAAADPPARADTSTDSLLDELRRKGPHAERYSLEGELGAGGNATVLAVRDRELCRRLAMKVLRRDAPSTVGRPGSRALTRFLEEAQITGQLAHPGIVPVHELGLDGQGRVYFTMALVRGETFERVIERVRAGEPDWTLARALGALLRVCEAVGYAHARGVIHRDLKPSNVMVGTFGEVYVMDWGLARVLAQEDKHDLRIMSADAAEAQGPDTARPETVRRAKMEEASASPLVTVDGDVIGTPCYMPPEQASGRLAELGPRSDVYGIGAMLYQLLAGHRPYLAPGEPSAPAAVLLAVRTRPPRPVRELDPSVPSELEAICETAMARDWAARYAGAMELADDLRAFLETRVVRAYETGGAAELRKWVQRNRGLAAASAAALLATLIGLASTSLVQARGRTEQTRLNEQLLGANSALEQRGAELALALERESAERALAERSFDRARQAVDEMLADIGAIDLESVPRMEPVRKELLEKALGFFQELLSDRPDDQALRRERARTGRSMADVLVQLGRFAEAEAVYDEQIGRLRELAAEDPGDLEHQHALAACLSQVSGIRQADGRLELAERDRGEAVEILEQIAVSPGASAGYARDLAVTLQELAQSAWAAGRAEQALELTRRAIEVARELADVHPDSADLQSLLAGLLDQAATLASNQGLHEESERHAREAWRIAETLFPRAPGDRSVRKKLVVLASNVGLRLMNSADPEEAEQVMRRGFALAAALEADFPTEPVHAQTCAVLGINLAAHFANQERFEEALELLEQSRARLEALARDFPERIEFAHHLAALLGNLAQVNVELGDLDAAQAQVDRALELQDTVLASLRDHPSVRAQAASVLIQKGCILAAQGNHSAAAGAVEEGLALGVQRADVLYAAAAVLGACAGAARADGELASTRQDGVADAYVDRALALLREAVEAGFRDVGRLDSDADLEPLRARPEFKEVVTEAMGG